MLLKLFLLFSFFLSCNGFLSNSSNSDSEDRNKILAAAYLATRNQTNTSNITSINFRAIAGSQTPDLNCTGTFRGHASILEAASIFEEGSTLENNAAKTNFSRHISETANFQLVDLKFYIYDIKLLQADGNKVDFTLISDGIWQSSTIALLDFEDGTGSCTGGTSETNKSIRGTAPAGNYTGIEFKLGVPFEQNHLALANQQAPLNNSSMYWSWQGGYKFLKLEFKANESTVTSNSIHLGSSGCPSSNSTGANSACTYPNRSTISISKTSGAINFSTESIAIDVQAVLNGTNSNATAGGSQLVCMSGNTTTACSSIFTNLGLTASTGTSNGSQKSFSIK